MKTRVILGAALLGALLVAAAPPLFTGKGTVTLKLPNDGGTATGTVLIDIYPADAGTPDAGTPDAGKVDAGSVPDAGPRDAATTPDAGLRPDAGTPTLDAGPALDAGPPPAGGNGIYDPNIPTGGAVIPGQSFVRPTVAMPAPGACIVDPVFGTTICRLLAHGSHEYAQLQPLSDDGKVVMLIEDGRGRCFWQFPSMQLIRCSPEDSGALRWIPGPGHRVVYISGQPARVMTMDVDTGVTTEVYRSAYQYARTAETYEQMSFDGRYTAFFPHDGEAASIAYAVDIIDKKVSTWSLNYLTLYSGGTCTPDPQYGAIGPNWLRASPDGQYFMVQWNKTGAGRCQGLELFDMQTGQYRSHVHDHGKHSDVATTPAGRMFVATVLDDSRNNNYPWLAYEWLDGAAPTITRVLPWETTGHHSCLGTRGICVSDGWGTAGSHAFADEVWAYDQAGNAWHLAHHHSSNKDYWVQPSPSISVDGKYVFFNSDWGVDGQGAPYVIMLPAPAGSVYPTPGADAGVPTTDAGSSDAGPRDAASPAPDAGPSPSDGGTPSIGTRVMPLGDSITVGFPTVDGYRCSLRAKWAAQGRVVDFVGSLSSGSASCPDKENEGHAGWKIGQVDAQVTSWLAAASPDVILLIIGTNDLLADTPQATAAPAAAALELLVGHILAARPTAMLYVGSVPPQRTPTRDQVALYNAAASSMAARLAATGKRIQYVDVSQDLTLADIDSDNLHPMAPAYEKMAIRWASLVTPN